MTVKSVGLSLTGRTNSNGTISYMIGKFTTNVHSGLSQVMLSSFLLIIKSKKKKKNSLTACLESPVMYTVQILCIGTDRSQQTVQTKIRLLLKKQSDQGLRCLPFHQHLLDALMQCYIKLFNF